MSLTRDEINELMDLLNDSKIIDQTTNYIFTGIDKDQSGLLEEEEFRKGLKKLFFELGGEEPSEEQIKRAFHKIDTNNDKKISRVELKELVKKFISSLKEIVEKLQKKK